MGGIIVIDFIDLSNPENRKILFDFLREEMNDDKAKHKILPSKFGLVQITRQSKTRVNIKTREDPNDVNGEIEAPILIIDRINSDLEEFKNAQRSCANTHPFVAYLTKVFHHYVQNGILSING
jgi:ribonuclease G